MEEAVFDLTLRGERALGPGGGGGGGKHVQRCRSLKAKDAAGDSRGPRRLIHAKTMVVQWWVPCTTPGTPFILQPS